MKTPVAILLSFLFVVFLAGAASAQTASPQTAPPAAGDSPAPPMLPGGFDPSLSLPFGRVGSAPGRGLPGGKDPSHKISASYRLAEAVDVAAKKEDWQTAGNQYQAALDLLPTNEMALYGLAKCAERDGNLDAAIGFYRTAIYSHDPKVYAAVPGDGFNTNNVEKMMDFVLVLSQAHQDMEAQKVYKQTAHVLNYEGSNFNGGKPFLRVLLSEFGTAPGDIAETPERLQAMAYVARSLEHGEIGSPLGIEEIRTSAWLYPDSPVVNYYLGEHLLGRYSHEAKAAYMKAEQLGDPQVKAAAHKRAEGLPNQ